MAQHHDHRIENEQRLKQKMPLLYCPFGCDGTQVAPSPNGNAECCHLIGHTIDERERVFEPIGMAPWNNEFFQTSRHNRQKVSAGDIVVNPQVKQMLRTGAHWAKRWASARVYRMCSLEQAEEWRRRHARPTDFDLNASLAEEDKDLRIKQLELELSALKGNPIEAAQDSGEPMNAVPFGPPEPGELDDAALEEILT